MPVFLVGSVRSGSTLLRLMINSHPRLSNPGECDFLFDQISGDGQYPDSGSYQGWLETNRIFLAKNLHVEQSLAFRELTHSFVQQMKEDNRLLTLNIHRHFEKVPFLFPDARYIHLVRDPRDVARSCIGMGWCGHVYFGSDIWLEAERSWNKLKPLLNDNQYMEIKYEELLEDIDAGLTRICNFLGVEYTREMLDYAQNSTYSLPDRKLCYQWKKKYTTRELQLVEGKLGSLLEDRGYESSGHGIVTPGPVARLSLTMKNRLYRIKNSIRTYGFPLYLERKVAGLSGLKHWKNSVQKRINVIDESGLK